MKYQQLNYEKRYTIECMLNTDADCQEYLAKQKREDGYICKKCSHTGCQTRSNHSKTCNKCSHTESPTANTLFHKVKFGVRKLFFICFKMSTTTKSLSASYMGVWTT